MMKTETKQEELTREEKSLNKVINAKLVGKEEFNKMYKDGLIVPTLKNFYELYKELYGVNSLIKLCKKACKFDNHFRSYIKDYEFLNEYYIETRYPAEEPLIADKEDVEEGINIVSKLKLLKKFVSHWR